MSPSQNTTLSGDQGVHEGVVWRRNDATEESTRCAKPGEAWNFKFLCSLFLVVFKSEVISGAIVYSMFNVRAGALAFNVQLEMVRCPLPAYVPTWRVLLA